LKHNQWTIADVLYWTVDHFGNLNFSTPRLDAELLMAFVLECPRLELYLRSDQPLNTHERLAYRELVKKRADGCPIAYLTGEKAFWSLNLIVNEHTLIPRPDTETLVENLIKNIKYWQKVHPTSKCMIAELGTGTAAIPLAICSELENLNILAVDRSMNALKVAKENLLRYESLLSKKNNRIELIESNLFSNVHPLNKLDFIISNPPYIPSDQISSLQVEISKYEPRIALDGGSDGLDFYRYLLKVTPKLLALDGRIFVEIGSDQRSDLNILLRSFSEWKSSTFYKDLQGNDRVWELRLS